MADNFEMKNYEFLPDDFELVQKEEKIKDKKLETKPTTFFRDALVRFGKNKSSVVSFFIIAVLVLLAIFVPIFSDSNIERVSTPEAFLAPKLFKAGTGFWDGTRSSKHVVYDVENEVPALSDKHSIASLKQSLVSLTVDTEPSYIDVASLYGRGGEVVLATDAAVLGKNSVMRSASTVFNVKDSYKLHIEFGNEDGVAESKLGEYEVYLDFGGEKIEVRGLSSDYSPIDFDISAALEEAGLENARGQIVFVVMSAEDAFRYILIDKAEITCSETAENAEDIAKISILDATDFINVSDKNDLAYWSCTGRKGIHNSIIYYCDYTVDTYMLVYGNADLVSYSATEIQNWVDAGWCEYDYKVGPESFKRLTDDCPIDTVASQTVTSVTKKLSSVMASGWNYRKLGYDKMPQYIFGTDASGFDIWKRAFAGLRTSLILGVLVAAFCLAFGLVWGSISGYFGGNVDIIMERFCEILGGVPWIVIMTLCILHLGNNLFVFFLALCITDWMGPAGTTRAQFYRFKGREYVLASRTLGATDIRLIFKHILPNSMGTIITRSVFMVTSVIYSEASLAYLNLGLQGSHSFGVLMADNQKYLSVYPNLVIFPAVIMTIIMIAMNLFGNGLRDAFNPQLKGSE